MQTAGDFATGFVMILLVVALATFAGALAGLLAGLVINGPFQDVLAALGVQPVEIWKLGAFIGFVVSLFHELRG